MNNKHLYEVMFLSSIGICSGIEGYAQSAVATTDKPNVLYILCDDLGYSDIEAYGQQMILTPNLNKMVKEGMSFTQFYASTSVSAPSRASLMTGQHTGHAKIRGNDEIQPEGQAPLAADIKIISELFKEAGYTTGVFGKWGLGYPGSGSEPIDRGFDTFYGYNCQRKAHSYYPEYLWHDKTKVNQNGAYSQDSIHFYAKKFISDNRDKAFFGYLTYTIPHASLEQPNDSLYKMYEDMFYEPNPYTSGGYSNALKPRAQFAAMITRLDTYVGEIMKLLEELDLDDKTLLIFTSDNGPHIEGGADPAFFNSEARLRGLKRALYEGGMRVPYIAWWHTKIPAGKVSHELAAGWDMMPTFTDLLGMKEKWNQATDGISILPTLLGKSEEQKHHDFLYWEFHEENGRQAVRSGDWKLIRQDIKNTPSHELYNIAKDPHEDTNIIDLFPEKAEELKYIMDREHTPSTDFNFGKK